ncbi:N-acetyltransferase [Amycolatopsis benzoatilytica]|uniref:N-acetyltransferase n=1 Tax=Amycolatopsis benzoatilytica TaxID=346045 RepID=UPI00038100F6|nr:N-acetyltransferase [Amycolatopsis benzoatilytica]
MIGYRWRESLDDEETRQVDELLTAAAAFDAEAGFPTALPAKRSTGATRHIVVTIAPKGERGNAELDRLPEADIVAYLRLELSDGDGDVQFVVRPEFRSHGVATLLAELLDERPDGWARVPGLRRLHVWAHGNHPAAERTARRFGAIVEHGVFKTLRLLGGSRPYRGPSADVRRSPAAEPPPEVVAGHRTAMAPDERAPFGHAMTRLSDVDGNGSLLVGVDAEDPAGHPACVAVETPDAGRELLQGLLSQALLDVQEAGARRAVLYVDALRADFVSASRELAFEHDHSDFCYVRPLTDN